MNNIDNNKVDELYNNLLESAKGIVENEDESTSYTDLKELDINTTESPISTTGIYNPITGDIAADTASINTKALSDLHFNRFAGGEEISLTFDEIKNILPRTVGSELDDLEEINILNNIIKKKINGEKISYDELPNFLKESALDIVRKSSDDGPALAFLGNKTRLNYATNLLIGELAKEWEKKNAYIDLDTMLAGFDQDFQKLQNETSKEFGNILMSFDEERKNEIDAAIIRCKAEGKEEAVEKLEKIKSVIDEAYNLTNFSEYCKHVRIKKFDLEKPKKVFLSFNAKYLKHSNNINDIQYCPVVLDRHIIGDSKSNMKLCLAFCKYCTNYSPDNIEEHSFMYYFIKNIILLDRINPKGLMYDSLDEKSKKFYDGFLDNIKKCILNLNNRQ